MRQAGTLPNQHDAERFANYLLTLGITSKIEPASSGEATIWIHDENQLDASKRELEAFRSHPADERYHAAEREARQVRREAAEKKRQLERNFIDMRNEWANPWRRRPITLLMVVACVGLYLGQGDIDTDKLMYSMPDVENGEIWRLVTPILLHGGLLHLLFNMWWLVALGTLIERGIGSLRYVALVLAVALASNYAQATIQGPNFVGMSGVVYGLFGYAWVRGRLEPASGLYLRPDIAYWMIGWLVLCWTPYISHVANWAHLFGLAAGGAIGYMASTLRQRPGNT
jgi:rhomboid protease GlpG